MLPMLLCVVNHLAPARLAMLLQTVVTVSLIVLVFKILILRRMENVKVSFFIQQFSTILHLLYNSD